MSGQFDGYGNNSTYWIITPYSASYVRHVDYYGYVDYSNPSSAYGVRPSLNLKSNVVITGGLGTKEQPFTIELAS